MADTPTAPSLAHAVTARDNVGRVLVTVAALTVYWVGGYVPVAVLDPGFLEYFDLDSDSSSQMLFRASLLNIGIMPLFSVLLAAELLKLASHRLQEHLRASEHNIARFNGYVLASALVFAALQAYSVAVVFEQATGSEFVPRPSGEPGQVFRLQFVMIAVAGSALSIWLADQITRHGTGSGMWLLYLAPWVSVLPYTWTTIEQQLAVNQIAVQPLQFLMVFAPAAIAILAAIERARRHFGSRKPSAADTFKLNYAPIWPPIIALTIANLVSAAFLMERQWRAEVELGPHYFQAGSPSSLALISALVFLLTYMQTAANFRCKSQDPEQADFVVSRLTFVTALAYALICIVFEVLRTHHQLPIMDGGTFIALVLVALSILPASLSAYLPDASPPPDPGDHSAG